MLPYLLNTFLNPKINFMKKIFLFLAIVCTFSFFISCKKGEDDPAISLKTRKARVTGEWHMTRGNIKVEEKVNGVVIGDLNYELTENSYTYKRSGSGKDTTLKGDYKMSLTLEKDGAVQFSQSLNSNIFQGSGTWNFVSGVGDAKKKESISFRITTLSGESYFVDLFNKSSTFFTYKIRELRNEKLVLESNAELVQTTDDGSSFYVTSIYTFVQ